MIIAKKEHGGQGITHETSPVLYVLGSSVMNVIFVGLYFFAVIIFLSLVFRFWGYISYKLFVFYKKIVNYIKSKK